MFDSKKKIEKELKEEQKEQRENQLKWHHYLISFLFVLVGAVLIAYKEIDIPFICRFFSCVFAIAGVICVLSYCVKDVSTGYYKLDLVYGVMLLFGALLFFTKMDAVGEYFPIIAGAILFANGVVKLQHSIDMKRIDKKMKKVTEMWLVVMIFALMCIAAGSVAVYLTPQNPRTLFIFIGISIIAAGITDVFTHLVFIRKVRIFKSGVTDTEETEDTKDSREAAENTLPDDTAEAVTGFEEEAVQQPVEEAVEEAVEVTAEETAEETTEEAADATD